MTKANLRSYTPEFREEAVKTVLAQGLSLEEASQRLAVPKGRLANWVAVAKRGAPAGAAPGSRTVAELEAEVAKLRKDLAEACMERDVLKNRPTRHAAPLMHRNFKRVHWTPARTVAACFLEV